jgi:predicted ATPase/GAF domain-containing protein/HPt (histidine-containing phosphotransfer) domain-containing protein
MAGSVLSLPETAQLLHSGPTSTIHRAVDASGECFVIKRSLLREDLAALGREWQLGRSIASPHVVRYRQRVADDALLLEYAGETLAARRGVPRSSAEVLETAIQIARGIQAIHAAGVVHGDLHPGNIYVDAAGTVRIGDFSRAFRASQAAAPSIRPDLRRNVLPYLAPELSGRTSQVVDRRADYYAFGAILFELVSGRTPFVETNPVEMLHAHAAIYPPQLHDIAPEVPEPLSLLVDKLLSKDADARYQSSFGLICDLQRIAHELAERGTVEDFALGVFDVSERFRLPARIYGRDRERAQLLEAFERASRGAPELTLIGGLGGSGKTALVNELRHPIAQADGMFVAGKFDEVTRSVAYSAICQALRGVARLLLGAGEAELERWRRRLGGALGNNGQLVCDLVPELESVLGRQPAVPQVGTAERKARFDRTMRALFRALAEDASLTVFLDDMQWSDPASRDLLVQIGSERGVRLLIVCAFRSEEVEEHHPLWGTVAAIRAAGTPVSRIDVTPLSPDDLAGLVRDTVGIGANGDIRGLAALIHRKTDGNPFFARFLLARLHEAGLLALDDAGRWTWSLDAIAAQRITDNVVELVVRRATELDRGEQRTLELGACIGTEFHVSTVVRALGAELSNAESPVDGAVQAGLIQQSDDELGVMRFVHDRVQQSIYRRIDPARRGDMHLAMARALSDELGAGVRHPVFVVVAQFNHALALLVEVGERHRAAVLNMVAGQAARSSGAYDAAREYFRAGVQLVGDEGWDRDHELTFGLHLGLSECEGLVGDDDSFDALQATIARRATSGIERAQVAVTRLARLASRGHYREAVADGIAALGHLGVAMPSVDDTDGIRNALTETLARHARRWGDRPIDAHADLPATHDPVHVLAMTILSSLVDCGMIGAPAYLPLVTATAVAYSVEHGNAPMAAMGYASHATVLVHMQRFREAYEYGRMALRLNELAPYPAVTAKLLNMYGGFVHHFNRPTRDALPVFREAIRAGLDTGDLLFATYASVNLTRGELFAGRNLLDILRNRAQTEAKLAALNNQPMYDFVQIFLGFVANMAGQSEAADRLDNAGFREADYYAAYGALPLLASHLHVYRMRAHYLHGRFDRVRKIFSQVDPAILSGQVECEHFHFFAALALLAEDHPADDAAVDRLVAMVERFAGACPENFGAHARMLAGERARRRGDLLAAVAAFDEAIAIAEHQALPHEAALAAELSARMWRSAGRARLAGPYIDAALAHYRAWGATALVARLEVEYGARREAGVASGNELDVLDVVSAASALSSEVHFDKLVDRLMQTVLHIAGAGRAVLLLNEDKPRVVGHCAGSRSELVDHLELGEFGELAEPAVQLAARTLQVVVIRDAQLELPECDYVVTTAQRSIFSAPLIKQGKLVGILYLENKLIAGAFTAERARTVELITGQLAVALENARLYEVVVSHSHELEVKVAARTEQLRAILDNVTFGFLVIDANLVVQHGYTRSCRDLLGHHEVAGRSFADLLGLDPSARYEYALSVAQVFEDVLPEAVTIAQLRTRFELANDVVLKAEAKAIRGADGQVSALLVSLSDVRAFEDTRRENEANRQLLAILRNKDAFRSFLVDTRRRLARARTALDDQLAVRRELHTIKGDSAMHGLDAIADEIHQIEDSVAIEPSHLDMVAELLGQFVAEQRWNFGIDLEAAREVVVDDDWLVRLASLIEGVPSPARAALRELHRLATLRSAASLLGPLDKLVANLATRLGKCVQLVLHGADVQVDPAVVEDVFRQLPHMLRNAIDHGIEPPHDRAGKPEVALLHVTVLDRGDHYSIAVADDGRGIDRDALLARAVAHDIVHPDELAALTDDQVLSLILHDGLSTARAVSATSGRGVGMAAVRAAVEERGGRITIRSVPGAGTTLELIIPRPGADQGHPLAAESEADVSHPIDRYERERDLLGA